MLKQDEIIELAKSINEDWWLDDIDIQAFAKLVAAAAASKAVEREREACAKVCNAEKRWWDGMSNSEKDIYQALDNASAVIRARGQT